MTTIQPGKWILTTICRGNKYLQRFNLKELILKTIKPEKWILTTILERILKTIQAGKWILKTDSQVSPAASAKQAANLQPAWNCPCQGHYSSWSWWILLIFYNYGLFNFRDLIQFCSDRYWSNYDNFQIFRTLLQKKFCSDVGDHNYLKVFPELRL